MNRKVNSDLCGPGIFEIAFRMASCAQDCTSHFETLALILSDAFLVRSSTLSIKPCENSNMALVFDDITLSCLKSTSTE